MKLTLSFPVGVLGEVNQMELYKHLFEGITEIIHEEDVDGIQIYPAQWPRKVLITLKNDDAKEALLIAGLNLSNMHVELQDESHEMVKITIKDAPVYLPDKKIEDVLNNYGRVIRTENEYLHVNGRKTNWKTGTRYVFMCPLQYSIPQKLPVMDEDKQISVSVWYRRTKDDNFVKCQKCGGGHRPEHCDYGQRVCFICQGNHERKECPKYDGSRVSKEVFCFLSGKSPLSNFSLDFPIVINDQRYTCNEQFIQSEKAKLFGDKVKYGLIMKSSDPREMKKLGREVSGYNDATWKRCSKEIIYSCVRQKVYQYREMKDYLLSTESRIIGEGSPDRHFGVGIHISDPAVMNPKEWPGNNLMGQALMDVRSELQLLVEMTSSPDGTPVISAEEHPVHPATSEHPVIPAMSEHPIHAGVADPAVNLIEKLDKFENPKSDERYVVLLGDSNAKGIKIDMTGSDMRLAENARAGAMIQDAEDLIGDIEVKPESVRVVVCHLGSYNWQGDVGTYIDNGEDIYREYVEALNSISSKFPHADLVVSSVLPRSTSGLDGDNLKHQKEINNQIDVLNRKLYQLSQEESNISFIDNGNGIILNDEPNKDLYATHDKTGVYLNERGLMILSDNITEGFRKMCHVIQQNDNWTQK